MHEPDLTRVEEVPRELRKHAPAVEHVARERVTDAREVRTDLVPRRSARRHFDLGEVPVHLHGEHLAARRPRVVVLSDAHATCVHRVRRDRPIDRAR